jgi:hypothetical protein
MAHFAKVVNNKVVNVIVAEPDFFETFVDDSPGEWIQTSYNTYGGKHYTELEDGQRVVSEDQSKALRYNFASVGSTYDREADAFIPEKIYESWLLNTETYRWQPPTPKPEGKYWWNEEDQEWVEYVFEE